MNVSCLRPGDAFEMYATPGTWEALPETCVVSVVHRSLDGGGVTAHIARVATRCAKRQNRSFASVSRRCEIKALSPTK